LRCLVVPGDAKGLQDVARARPEVDHVALHHRVLPVESDAEALTHAAAAAVAPHKIGATHDLGGARQDVSQDNGDSVAILGGGRPAGGPRGGGRRAPGGAGCGRRWLDVPWCAPRGGPLWLAAVVVPTVVAPPLVWAAIAEPA